MRRESQIKEEIKKIDERQYKQEWKLKTEQTNRLKFYTYLAYPIRKVRVAYKKYRISDHNLRIERDMCVGNRQKKDPIPREEGKCRKCQEGIVEDEKLN